jgi:hypothetical protein
LFFVGAGGGPVAGRGRRGRTDVPSRHWPRILLRSVWRERFIARRHIPTGLWASTLHADHLAHPPTPSSDEHDLARSVHAVAMLPQATARRTLSLTSNRLWMSMSSVLLHSLWSSARDRRPRYVSPKEGGQDQVLGHTGRSAMSADVVAGYSGRVPSCPTCTCTYTTRRPP